MSSVTKCPICKKCPVQPINLKCDHHPCYNCVQPLMAVESQSKIETKYKIHCPACSKKTVFYDLRHLILTKGNQEQEEIFVTDKFINQKPQAKILPSHRLENNFLSNETISNHMTRRGSIQSIANNNKMMVEVKCSEHGQAYKYFCSDCGQNYQRSFLLCGECAKPHYNGGHKLLTLRQSQSKILGLSMSFKEDIKVKKGEINYLIDFLSNNKGAIDEYYCSLEQSLNAEFKNIFGIIQSKYNSLRAVLKSKYDQNVKDINVKIQKLSNQYTILQSLKQIEFKDLQTNLKFCQTYQKFTVNNQINLVKPEIDFSKLPQIFRKIENMERIAQEWIDVRSGEVQSEASYKKSRKNSNGEELCTYRSQRQKQNKIIGLSPSDQKINLRKILS